MAPFFVKGLAIGFLIAAPVGPIGVLCIRRSLVEGWRSGFCTGVGAATADALFGMVAAFGLTAVSVALMNQKGWLTLLGGVFLCYLGARTALAKPLSTGAEAKKANLGASYWSTVLLTLTNPATILSFIAVFAGFGLTAAPNLGAAALLVSGVFLGSAAWWFLLSSFVAIFQRRLTPAAQQFVNVLSGAILMVFGLLALFSMLKSA